MTFTVEEIARVCHAANRGLCEVDADFSQKSWEEAAEWQRKSAADGVKFALANPDASDSAQHEAWMASRIADGWVYGETKDEGLKTHPCLVPYEQLPAVQRAKDGVFRTIVAALSKY